MSLIHDPRNDVYLITLSDIMRAADNVTNDKNGHEYVKNAYRRRLVSKDDQWGYCGNELLSKKDTNFYEYIGKSMYHDNCPYYKSDFKRCKTWDYMQHTEAQFSVLQQLIKNNEIDTNHGKIKIEDIDNVKILYSMFEPCESCRSIIRTQNDKFFLYFAIDSKMPGDPPPLADNKSGQIEICPFRIWKNYDVELRGYDYGLNSINWNAEYNLKNDLNDLETFHKSEYPANSNDGYGVSDAYNTALEQLTNNIKHIANEDIQYTINGSNTNGKTAYRIMNYKLYL